MNDRINGQMTSMKRILVLISGSGSNLQAILDGCAGGKIAGQVVGVNPNTMQRALAQLEAEGLVYTERTTGRFVTEDTALLEQLRDETACAMTAEYLEKMRGIGYGPAEAAKLMTGWETKESD
jgi:DNA-binding MarR family transcriptional regulator